MICRYEQADNDTILVISEVDVFLGQCEINSFVDCIEDRDTFEEDDFIWYYVNKEKLFSVFSAKK